MKKQKRLFNLLVRSDRICSYGCCCRLCHTGSCSVDYMQEPKLITDQWITSCWITHRYKITRNGVEHTQVICFVLLVMAARQGAFSPFPVSRKNTHKCRAAQLSKRDMEENIFRDVLRVHMRENWPLSQAGKPFGIERCLENDRWERGWLRALVGKRFCEETLERNEIWCCGQYAITRSPAARSSFRICKIITFCKKPTQGSCLSAGGRKKISLLVEKFKILRGPLN